MAEYALWPPFGYPPRYPLRQCGEWDREKNKDLSPDLLTNHASIKVWWKCAKGHSWQALVRSRTIIGTGCPVCAGKVASPDYNLATEYPDLVLDWIGLGFTQE